MSVDTFSWFVSAAALIGVWLNIKKIKWCFAIWAVTNICWCMIDLHKGVVAQSVLQYVYALLSIWGLFEWTGDGARREKATMRKELSDG